MNSNLQSKGLVCNAWGDRVETVELMGAVPGIQVTPTRPHRFSPGKGCKASLSAATRRLGHFQHHDTLAAGPKRGLYRGRLTRLVLDEGVGARIQKHLYYFDVPF